MKQKTKQIQYKTTKKYTEERIEKILEIKEKKGLTAEALIEEAKPKNSPLHDLFNWDDGEAAKQWRLQQARVIINEIKVVIDEKEYYAFEIINVSTQSKNKEESEEETKVYMGVQEITGDSDFRKQIVSRAYSQLEYWKNKYHVYQEFKNMSDYIVALGEELKKKGVID